MVSFRALIHIPCALLLIAGGAASAQTPTPAHSSKAEFEQMMKDLSNWGRWGKDDQLGTVNLITPAKRKAAAKLVTEGVSVSLSRDTDSVKSVDNGTPFVDKMVPPVDGQFNMDEYTVFFHGFAVTHIDALSHVFYKDHMYNGFSQSEIQPDGARKLAIAALKDGIFTRGVLVDMPWLRGVPYLENNVVIYPSDLEKDRCPHRKRRRGLHPHRTLGATGSQRPMGDRQRFGRARSAVDRMAEEARHRDTGWRCRVGRAALGDG
jgi:hypothetical protein